jgi:hypothetical protein
LDCYAAVTRSVVAALLVGALGAGAAACAVENPSQRLQPDATPPPDAEVPPDATPLCTDLVTPNATISAHPADNDHIPGGGCLGTCHDDSGVAGPKFTIAGSLWNRYSEGGDPIAGATVVVIGSNGTALDLVTNAKGQFFTDEVLPPPIRTYATACPDAIPMQANASGNCNLGNCHGPSQKIYLPPAAL